MNILSWLYLAVPFVSICLIWTIFCIIYVLRKKEYDGIYDWDADLIGKAFPEKRFLFCRPKKSEYLQMMVTSPAKITLRFILNSIELILLATNRLIISPIMTGRYPLLWRYFYDPKWHGTKKITYLGYYYLAPSLVDSLYIWDNKGWLSKKNSFLPPITWIILLCVLMYFNKKSIEVTWPITITTIIVVAISIDLLIGTLKAVERIIINIINNHFSEEIPFSEDYESDL